MEDTCVEWAEIMMERSPLALRMIKAGLNAELDGQAGIQEFLPVDFTARVVWKCRKRHNSRRNHIRRETVEDMGFKVINREFFRVRNEEISHKHFVSVVFPSNVTVPDVGVRKPPMIRSVVVLPQPEEIGRAHV